MEHGVDQNGRRELQHETVWERREQQVFKGFASRSVIWNLPGMDAGLVIDSNAYVLPLTCSPSTYSFFSFANHRLQVYNRYATKPMLHRTWKYVWRREKTVEKKKSFNSMRLRYREGRHQLAEFSSSTSNWTLLEWWTSTGCGETIKDRNYVLEIVIKPLLLENQYF